MTRPIFDIRLARLWGVGILGMALSVTGWSQTPYKSPERDGRAFWILTTGTYTAGIADSHTTMTNQREWSGREMNPLLGPHPSNLRTYGTIGGLNTLAVYSSWELRKHGKRWWWAPMAGSIAVNLWGVQNNMRNRYDTSVRCTQYSDGRRVCR